MPIHDWSRVGPGIFHDFHTAWLAELRRALNAGVLPDDYYALVEQHAGRFVPDLLTLQVADRPAPPPAPGTGGLALAEAPPRVRHRLTAPPAYGRLRRSLAIRHVSGHRLVAVIEVASPGNKDRADHVREFATKALALLDAGVHVLLVDLFPPGPHDPRGLHGAIWERLDPGAGAEADAGPFTMASYLAGPLAEAFVEHRGLGDELPEMPLFIDEGRYVLTPLETSYDAAFRGAPAFWRALLG